MLYHKLKSLNSIREFWQYKTWLRMCFVIFLVFFSFQVPKSPVLWIETISHGIINNLFFAFWKIFCPNLHRLLSFLSIPFYRSNEKGWWTELRQTPADSVVYLACPSICSGFATSNQSEVKATCQLYGSRKCHAD